MDIEPAIVTVVAAILGIPLYIGLVVAAYRKP